MHIMLQKEVVWRGQDSNTKILKPAFNSNTGKSGKTRTADDIDVVRVKETKKTARQRVLWLGNDFKTANYLPT